jgi:uncharacterized membrane protein
MTDSSRFPHDRVVFFSDAVFAIAITLLVIEIKIPTHEQVNEHGLGDSLRRLTPLFVGYFMSFLVTALFWKAHLQLCQHIKTFNERLVWINIWLLLFVALMPFSTALYFENLNDNIAFFFYCVNLACIGMMSYWMHAYTIKRENLNAVLSRASVRWLRIRVLIAPIVFLLCIPMAIFMPIAISRWAFILIFIFQFIGRKKFERKAAPTS